MHLRIRRFRQKQWDPVTATQTFVKQWQKQFRLFTRAELKVAAAQAGTAYQENLTDRALATKFMIVTTALKHSLKDPKPSVLKRFLFLRGDLNTRIDNFLSAPLRIPASISDAELLGIVKYGRISRQGNHRPAEAQDAEATRLAHFTD
jgi:hypothetical protein